MRRSHHDGKTWTNSSSEPTIVQNTRPPKFTYQHISSQINFQPFLSWLLCTSVEMTELKNTLKMFNGEANSFVSKTHFMQLSRLRLYFQSMMNYYANSLFYLRLRHKKKPIANYAELSAHYNACMTAAKDKFLLEARKIANKVKIDKDLWYHVKSFCSSIIRNIGLYKADYVGIVSGTRKALKDLAIVDSSDQLPEILSMGRSISHGAALSAGLLAPLLFSTVSRASYFVNDLSKISKKPKKSAAKIGGTLLLAAIPVVLVAASVIAWPVTTVILASLGMAAIGRGIAKAVMQTLDFKKTGHRNSNKYLVTEKRIAELAEFGLNRLQIEDLRVFIEERMRAAKIKRFTVTKGSIGQRLCNLGSVVMSVFFGYYFHTKQQVFCANLMRILQGKIKTQNNSALKRLVSIYNEYKDINRPKIVRFMSVGNYSQLTRNKIKSTELGHMSSQTAHEGNTRLNSNSCSLTRTRNSIFNSPQSPARSSIPTALLGFS